MNFTDTLVNIISSMRTFQKINNIEKQCITNCQYLYDFIKLNSIEDVRIQAFIVFSNDINTQKSIAVAGHLSIVITCDDGEDVIFEPSYDVFVLTKKMYFDNISNFLKKFSDEDKSKFDLKHLISQHIEFVKYAKQMNDGMHIIVDREYYDEQADYVEYNLNK